jgi:hypothetical protein
MIAGKKGYFWKGAMVLLADERKWKPRKREQTVLRACGGRRMTPECAFPPDAYNLTVHNKKEC